VRQATGGSALFGQQDAGLLSGVLSQFGVSLDDLGGVVGFNSMLQQSAGGGGTPSDSSSSSSSSRGGSILNRFTGGN